MAGLGGVSSTEAIVWSEYWREKVGVEYEFAKGRQGVTQMW